MNQLKIVPARSQFNTLRQICNFIPGHLVSHLTRETGADKKAREFSCWSHVVAMFDALRERELAIRQAGQPETESTGVLHEEPAPYRTGGKGGQAS